MIIMYGIYTFGKLTDSVKVNNTNVTSRRPTKISYFLKLDPILKVVYRDGHRMNNESRTAPVQQKILLRKQS